MRRWSFAFAGLVGFGLFAFLIPLFDAPQPRGLAVTRGQARAIADAEAVRWRIPLDKAFVIEVWEESNILEKEFEKDPARRRRAEADPVVGPRLGGYRISYFRQGAEKFPPYGDVIVGIHGEILGARRQSRQEDTGAAPKAEALRPLADAFVSSRVFAGAPSPVFEDARPNVMRTRTDYTFRYRVPSSFPTGDVVFYLNVYFIGDQPAGWVLIEEYKDGRRFAFESGAGIVTTFLRFGVILVLLIVLLVIFLRKYHAGEVGVGTGAWLLGVTIAVSLLFTALVSNWSSYGTGFGALDARLTMFTMAGFKFLFYDIPLALLVFLAWSVGESIARERWSERLASFDALLRRDAVNATVGGALADGLLAAPAVAALALVPPLVPLLTGSAHAVLGSSSEMILNSSGSVVTVLLAALLDAILFSCVGLLFLLAVSHRRRVLAVGVVATLAFAAALAIPGVPIGPFPWGLVSGIGGAAVCLLVFGARDLLASATALFAGSLLLGFAPIILAATGPARTAPVLALLLPLLAIAAVAGAGIATKRPVAYSHDDLAPHVKRIVERERIKAEIDAANRIQAALLPSTHPDVGGASVASHYRAATEIGGDYFDFLPLEGGKLGLAFGDVAGHGLTSGIVMAMTKAALLVQVRHDASPVRVLEILNDIVMKTAPKRMLMTFFFGVLDSETSTLRFASAGHLDPYVFRAREKKLELLSSWGFPLGVKRREAFHESVVQFEAGDRLVLYSDGLIEALNDDGEPFGFERFEGVILSRGARGADVLKQALLESVKAFTRNRPPEDDQTLVVVSFEGRQAVALRAS